MPVYSHHDIKVLLSQFICTPKQDVSAHPNADEMIREYFKEHTIW